MLSLGTYGAHQLSHCGSGTFNFTGDLLDDRREQSSDVGAADRSRAQLFRRPWEAFTSARQDKENRLTGIFTKIWCFWLASDKITTSTR
jgi:hypothetical protein